MQNPDASDLFWSKIGGVASSAMNRSRLLCNVNDVADNVGKLPIINMSSPPTIETNEWMAYLKQIYPRRTGVIDLNTFTWFYWDAPLSIDALQFCDNHFDLEDLADGTPWTGGKEAWDWGPEHYSRKLGFFVYRRRTPAIGPLVDSSNLEVLRIKTEFTTAYEAAGFKWFYQVVGSGLYIHTNASYHTPPYSGYKDDDETSWPRRELIFSVPECVGDFWCKRFIHISLWDGGFCNDSSANVDILFCENQHISLYDASKDPLCWSDTNNVSWMWFAVLLPLAPLMCMCTLLRRRIVRQWSQGHLRHIQLSDVAGTTTNSAAFATPS